MAVCHFINIGAVGTSLGLNLILLTTLAASKTIACATPVVITFLAEVPQSHETYKQGIVLFNGANDCPITIGSTSG